MTRRRKTKTHQFTLLLHGADPLQEQSLNALFEAGCGDGTFGRRDGVYRADFDRKAPSLAEAISSAREQVEAAVPGLEVFRVEPEELVTAAEIASRTGRSRESVRLLFEGKRGPGSFPAPAVWLAGDRRLWRWPDVAQWFATQLGERVLIDEDALFIGALNSALELRRLRPELSRRSRARIGRLLSAS